MIKPMSWDELFMRHVYLIARKSKDPKTKIGAVLVRDKHVISEGYNGICIDVNDNIPERSDRPLKYSYYEHGERNSIYTCSRFGISSLGSIMYTQGVPCCDCARGVIQGGIAKVVVHKQWQEYEKKFYWQKWIDSAKISSIMFQEAGIPVEIFDMELNELGYLDGNEIKV